MSLEREFSIWYLNPEVGSIYTTVSLKKILLPDLYFEAVIVNRKLHRDVETLTQNELDKRKPFSVTVNYYDTIENEIRIEGAIEHDVAEDNKDKIKV